jgi:SAM-dependent methyltransferase
MKPLVSPDAVVFWNAQAAAWSAMADDDLSFYTMRTRWIADLVERHAASGSVLDLGCGPGLLTREFLRRGYDAYGADIAPAMIEAARADGDPTRFRVSADGTIPFARSFDTITAVGVFPYARDYGRLAADIRAHVISGGIVAASCTKAGSLYTVSEVCRRLVPGRSSLAVVRNLIRTGLWSAGFVDRRSSRQSYTPSSFDAVLRSAGLERIDSLSLYNWSAFDARPFKRGRVARCVARFLAWTYVGVYRAVS